MRDVDVRVDINPDRFIADVERALDRIDAARTAISQDELDVWLLGGELPAWPIPAPKADCRDCEGCGWTCSCHGLPYTFCKASDRQRCKCVPKPGRPRA